MKCKYSFLSLLLTLIIINIISITQVCTVKLQLRAPAKKEAEEDVISDKELDALLKDPKYASLAGSLAETGSGGADLSLPSTKAESAPVKSKSAHSASSDSHYMSSSYKDHLDRMKNGKSKSTPKLKVDPLDSMDLLGKSLSSDPLKELELLGGGSLTPTKTEEKPKDKKAEAEDKFKAFDFISKQQARFLIEILKQPVFYNMLPSEAQQIVHSINDNFSFKIAENEKLNDFLEASLMNSPNSQTFVDPDGTIGRKGILTLIDPETGDSKYVWTISNAKVLSFFNSQSLLTIVKLYRNSSLMLKDVNATPCFLLSSMKDLKDGSILACATSTQEKEVWVQTIRTHINK